jgi:uncharacterized membrane protein
MRHILLAVPLLLAACAQHPRPYAPVDNVRYSAIGYEPFWMVTIGDDAIVLTQAPDPGAEAARLNSHRYPRTLPRTVDGVQRWESGDGTAVISVEAVEEECQGSGGRTYRDRVVVRLSGREFQGCGGPVLRRERTG